MPITPKTGSLFHAETQPFALQHDGELFIVGEVAPVGASIAP
jgi:hypothetical protein